MRPKSTGAAAVVALVAALHVLGARFPLAAESPWIGVPVARAEGGATRPKAASAPFAVGESTGGVTATLLDGGTWTVEGARGKVTVLLFAGAGAEQVPALKKLGDLARTKERVGRIRAVGILGGVAREAAADLVKAAKLKPDMAFTVDPEGLALRRFAETGTTRVVVLDRLGKVALSEGTFTTKAVAAKVDELLLADAAFFKKIETLTAKDLAADAGLYDAITGSGLEVLPPLFENMGKSKSAEMRDNLQSCVKHVLRRDYLARHPEFKYVIWIEENHSAQLLEWWSALDKKTLEDGTYALPPVLEAREDLPGR